MTEMKMSRNYIEFRVYTKDDADVKRLLDAADQLQDFLTDETACNPDVFTQDVSYEVKVNVTVEKTN